jgi:hypothetical protein
MLPAAQISQPRAAPQGIPSNVVSDYACRLNRELARFPLGGFDGGKLPVHV